MQLTDFFDQNTSQNTSQSEARDFLLPICHGFACACACLGTQTIEKEQYQEWWEAVIENLELDADDDNDLAIEPEFVAFNSDLFTAIREEANELEIQFNEQERVWLPFTPHPDNEALSDWAASFMIVVMQDAEFWHQKEPMDEALLPIVVFSGLFEDESIKEIEEDEEVLFDMAEEIPDLLTDIYLLLHEE